MPRSIVINNKRDIPTIIARSAASAECKKQLYFYDLPI